jgi:hypothetical protein
MGPGRFSIRGTPLGFAAFDSCDLVGQERQLPFPIIRVKAIRYRVIGATAAALPR